MEHINQHRVDVTELQVSVMFIFLVTAVFGYPFWTLQVSWLLSPVAKRIRKLMQVDTSLQNQNLCTDLRRVAKRIRKSACKSQKNT